MFLWFLVFLRGKDKTFLLVLCVRFRTIFCAETHGVLKEPFCQLAVVEWIIHLARFLNV